MPPSRAVVRRGVEATLRVATNTPAASTENIILCWSTTYVCPVLSVATIDVGYSSTVVTLYPTSSGVVHATAPLGVIFSTKYWYESGELSPRNSPLNSPTMYVLPSGPRATS